MLVEDRIKCIRREVDLLLHDNEARSLYDHVVHAITLEGDIAEVGVFEGGSAKLICEAKGNKHLYLFDTFKGNPEGDEYDAPDFKGAFKFSYRAVQHYLKGYPNVHIIRGLFPDTAAGDSFCMVHIDTDSHKSTSLALGYFYPRLVRGGVILVHDIGLESIRQAMLELKGGHPDCITENLAGHCRVIKP